MTRAEIEALARRIALAMMGRDEFAGLVDRQTWAEQEAITAFSEARGDRNILTDLYSEFLRDADPSEASCRARAEWLAGVLAEAFEPMSGLLVACELCLAELDRDDTEINVLAFENAMRKAVARAKGPATGTSEG